MPKYGVDSIGLAFVLLLSSVDVTQANHHTYDLNEIFSNADGTIQFVELLEANGSNNQHVFTNRVIDAASGEFLFDSDLPNSSTANTHVLVATAAFAALAGAPTPDYILPDGFVDIDGDTVRFCNATGCPTAWDTLAFASLPTDGVTSLGKSGTGTNSPTNFLGDTGTVDASTSENVPLLPEYGIAILAVSMTLVGMWLARRTAT
jgi:hypothetical protein